MNDLGDLGVAIAILLIVCLAFAWKNPPKNKVRYAAALIAGIVVMAVIMFAVPESGQRSPLFAPAIFFVFLLCIPLIRWRFRGSAEAQAVFRRHARQGKWKPPLWWAPVLVLAGLIWAFASLVIFADFNINSGMGTILVLGPFIVLEFAGCGVVGYRVYLWQTRMLSGDN